MTETDVLRLTGVVLIGDTIQANLCLVSSEIKGYQVTGQIVGK